MNESRWQRQTRFAWLLVVLGILYVLGTVALAMWTNRPARPARWDFDGTPFVPASSPQAEGYYHAGEGANPARPGVAPSSPAMLEPEAGR